MNERKKEINVLESRRLKSSRRVTRPAVYDSYPVWTKKKGIFPRFPRILFFGETPPAWGEGACS